MTREVPFLTRDQIESQANELRIAYGVKFGIITTPPVPVDEILNTFLKVALDFDDLPALLQTDSDVFGATWLDRKQVVIDQSLDPTNYPRMVGRYNFTVGHETGHWQLHRTFFEHDKNQQQLFELPQPPSVVCRTSQSKDRIEWQADYFSSCLLMPKKMLEERWRSRYGLEPMSVGQLRKMTPHGFKPNSEDQVIEHFCKSLSLEFQVSSIAMRIRLETLGMIVRNDRPNLFSERSNLGV